MLHWRQNGNILILLKWGKVSYKVNLEAFPWAFIYSRLLKIHDMNEAQQLCILIRKRTYYVMTSFSQALSLYGIY